MPEPIPGTQVDAAATKLIEKIQSGCYTGYKPGEPLKANSSLATEFGVSTTTIHQAVMILVDRGYVNVLSGRRRMIAKRLPNPPDPRHGEHGGPGLDLARAGAQATHRAGAGQEMSAHTMDSVDLTSLEDLSFLTVAEVAGVMRVSKMTVYRMVHSGELTTVRVGRSFRIPAKSVRDFLSEASVCKD